MRFTRKDSVATGLVAAVITIYLAYLVFDGVPFVRDPEGMAGIGLIIGFASRRIGGRAAFAHQRIAFAAGLGSMALGILALITASELVLALFVASIIGLWAAAVYVHMHVLPVRRLPVAH